MGNSSKIHLSLLTKGKSTPLNTELSWPETETGGGTLGKVSGPTVHSLKDLLCQPRLWCGSLRQGSTPLEEISGSFS